MDVLIIITSAILGVFLGAQLAEAFLIVPYWKSLSKEQFYVFYERYGAGIHRFFAPLTIASGLLPVLLLILSYIKSDERFYWIVVLVCCVVLFFGTYFVYFKAANEAFTKGTFDSGKLKIELIRWGRWHWFRIVFEALAFFILLML